MWTVRKGNDRMTLFESIFGWIVSNIWDNLPTLWTILPNRVMALSLVIALLATGLRFIAKIKSNRLLSWLYPILFGILSAISWLLDLLRDRFRLHLVPHISRTFADYQGRDTAFLPILSTLPSLQAAPRWTDWIVPLTGAGCVLGVVLVARSAVAPPAFVDLSLFFGALIAVAPLALGRENRKYFATFLVAWGVFGELLAIWVVATVADASSQAITWGLRALLLTFKYVLGNPGAPAQEKRQAPVLALQTAKKPDGVPE
jgi:hypothetical protein